MTDQRYTPDAILQTAFSFWSSKVLLTGFKRFEVVHLAGGDGLQMTQLHQ